MDFKKIEVCPVCKNKLFIEPYNRNGYRVFRCSTHFNGSSASLAGTDRFIYQSIIVLNDNLKLDIRYSEQKNKVLYKNASIYNDKHAIHQNINDFFSDKYIKDLDPYQIYELSQKVLNNISFI